MFTRDEAQKLAQKVIGFSTFPECQVTVTASEQAYTRFANNGITTASLGMRANRFDLGDARRPNGFERGRRSGRRIAARGGEEGRGTGGDRPAESGSDAGGGPQKYPEVNDFDDTANARAPQMIPHVKTIIDAAMKRKLVAAGLIEQVRGVRSAWRTRRVCSGFMNRPIRS